MRSGSMWLAVLTHPTSPPIGLVEATKPQAIDTINNLPKMEDCQLLLFKLSLHRGRLYARRERYKRHRVPIHQRKGSPGENGKRTR